MWCSFCVFFWFVGVFFVFFFVFSYEVCTQPRPVLLLLLLLISLVSVVHPPSLPWMFPGQEGLQENKEVEDFIQRCNKFEWEFLKSRRLLHSRCCWSLVLFFLNVQRNEICLLARSG